MWALKEGIAAARGDVIGLMIDGARMVTPGVMRNVADAYKAFPDAVVATAGFHIGDDDHQNSSDRGHDENRRSNYSLGPVAGERVPAVLGIHRERCQPLRPAAPADGVQRHVRDAGGDRGDRRADERFDQAGGGVLNLDLFRELVELPGHQLVVLPGEATFPPVPRRGHHQQDSNRESLLQAFRYATWRSAEALPCTAARAGAFRVRVPYAMGFLHYSARQGRDRFERRTRRPIALPAWDDEPVVIDRDTGRPRRLESEGGDMGIYMPASIRHFYPRRLMFSTWVDHIQFGYDLVAALKPRAPGGVGNAQRSVLLHLLPVGAGA